MSTPPLVTALAEGEVFVFGSNAQGQHVAGAARMAYELFGAGWGVGEGLTGRCWALPTMEGRAALESAVDRFLYFAELNPDLTFLVTPVGCGIAGYTPADVAPLFKARAANVVLPVEFESVLGI